MKTRYGFKTFISEDQFLNLDPKVQELLFNMLYCEAGSHNNFSPIYFRKVRSGNNTHAVESTYMNGTLFPYCILVTEVCKKITLGALMEAAYSFGSLRINVSKNYDRADKKSRVCCDLNYDYYSEASEFRGESFEIIDALLEMLSQVYEKRFKSVDI